MELKKLVKIREFIQKNMVFENEDTKFDQTFFLCR